MLTGAERRERQAFQPPGYVRSSSMIDDPEASDDDEEDEDEDEAEMDIEPCPFQALPPDQPEQGAPPRRQRLGVLFLSRVTSHCESRPVRACQPV